MRGFSISTSLLFERPLPVAAAFEHLFPGLFRNKVDRVPSLPDLPAAAKELLDRHEVGGARSIYDMAKTNAKTFSMKMVPLAAAAKFYDCWFWIEISLVRGQRNTETRV